MNEKNLSVIVPSAGLGYRMKSYGPKSIINLGGGNLMVLRQISLIRSLYPKAQIILVTGFQAEKVYKVIPPNIDTIENEFYKETNVAYSISLGLKKIKYDNVLILYGDLVFNSKTLNFPLSLPCIVTDSNKQMKDGEVGVTVTNGEAAHFSYGLPVKWAQIAYLKGKELELFDKFASNQKFKRYYGFEILNLVLVNGGAFKCFEPTGMRIVDVDNADDIDVAKILVKEK